MGKKNKDPVEREPPRANNYRSQETIPPGYKPSVMRKPDRIDRRSSILMKNQSRKIVENTKCDLSIETDNCILRRFYKRRLLSPVNKVMHPVRVNNTGTGSEFVIKRPDGSACGDQSKTDELGPPVVTSEALAINNLKTLLSKLLEKHLNENNELRRGTRKTLTDLLKSLQTPIYRNPLRHPIRRYDEERSSDESNTGRFVSEGTYRQRRYRCPRKLALSRKLAKKRIQFAVPRETVHFLDETESKSTAKKLESVKSSSKTSIPKVAVIEEKSNDTPVTSKPSIDLSLMFNKKSFDEQSSIDEGMTRRRRRAISSLKSHSSDMISWSNDRDSGDAENRRDRGFHETRPDARNCNVFTIFDFKSPRWLMTKIIANDLTKHTSKDLQYYYMHQLMKSRMTKPKRSSSSSRNEVNMISVYESVRKWPLQKKPKNLYDSYGNPPEETKEVKVPDDNNKPKQEENIYLNCEIKECKIKTKCNTATEPKVSEDNSLTLSKTKGFKVNRSKRKPIVNFKRSNPFNKDINVNILNALKNYPASLELRKQINKILKNESYTIIGKSSKGSLSATIPSKTTLTEGQSYHSSLIAIQKIPSPGPFMEIKANILDLIDPLSNYNLRSGAAPAASYSIEEILHPKRTTSTQYAVVNLDNEPDKNAKSNIDSKTKCVEVISQCTNTYDLEITKEINELQIMLRGLLNTTDRLLGNKSYKKDLADTIKEQKESNRSVAQTEVTSHKTSKDSVADVEAGASKTETHNQKEIKKRFERNKAYINKIFKAEKALLSKKKKRSSYNIIDSETLINTIDMTQYTCVLPKNKGVTAFTSHVPISRSAVELSASKPIDNKTLYSFWKSYCNDNAKISSAVTKTNYKSTKPKVQKNEALKQKRRTDTVEAAKVNLKRKDKPHKKKLLKSNLSLEKRITEVKLDVSHIENESNFIDYLDYDSELATYSKKSQENYLFLDQDENIDIESGHSQNEVAAKTKREKPVKKMFSKIKYLRNGKSKEMLQPLNVYRPAPTQVYKYLTTQTQRNQVPRMNTILQIRNLSGEFRQYSEDFGFKANEPIGDGPQMNMIHAEPIEDDPMIEDDETFRIYQQNGFLPKNNDLFMYEKKYCLRCLLYLFLTLVFFIGLTWVLYYIQRYPTKYKKKTPPRNNRTIPTHRW